MHHYPTARPHSFVVGRVAVPAHSFPRRSARTARRSSRSARGSSWRRSASSPAASAARRCTTTPASCCRTRRASASASTSKGAARSTSAARRPRPRAASTSPRTPYRRTSSRTRSGTTSWGWARNGPSKVDFKCAAIRYPAELSQRHLEHRSRRRAAVRQKARSFSHSKTLRSGTVLYAAIRGP
jgi:hypothetical protein